jgi:L-threonylcarbamoyladenylate synthase
MTEILPAHDLHNIAKALRLLNNGEAIAFPTDTVYGVGVCAMQAQAIEALYRIKARHRDKAIPVLLADIRDLAGLAIEISPLARQLAGRFWPGPLTLVVKKHPDLPAAISPTPTIGVRIPDHPVALNLLSQAGPLAVTSANLSGGPEARTAGQVYAQLQDRIPLVIDGGRTPGGSPSTVVDCTGEKPAILRAGPIQKEVLLEFSRTL